MIQKFIDWILDGSGLESRIHDCETREANLKDRIKDLEIAHEDRIATLEEQVRQLAQSYVPPAPHPFEEPPKPAVFKAKTWKDAKAFLERDTYERPN